MGECPIEGELIALDSLIEELGVSNYIKIVVEGFPGYVRQKSTKAPELTKPSSQRKIGTLRCCTIETSDRALTKLNTIAFRARSKLVARLSGDLG